MGLFGKKKAVDKASKELLETVIKRESLLVEISSVQADVDDCKKQLAEIAEKIKKENAPAGSLLIGNAHSLMEKRHQYESRLRALSQQLAALDDIIRVTKEKHGNLT